MIHAIEDRIGRVQSAWTAAVQRQPIHVVWLSALLAALALYYVANYLGINTDEDDLFSKDLPFSKLRIDFEAAFPLLADPIAVVIDAKNLEDAQAEADALAEVLRNEPEHFVRVYQPGGGEFFDTHGLLFLDTEELEDLVDHLADAQPFLAELARDNSLRGFSKLLSEALESIDDELAGVGLANLLERFDESLQAQLAGESHSVSWAEVIRGEDFPRKDRRRFLIVQAVVDFEQLHPAEPALKRLNEIAAERMAAANGAIEIRDTGIYSLAHEETIHVRRVVGWAGGASFVLVGIVLAVALRSFRLVAASLFTLLVGLTWTAGFASILVGHLNLISVAFAVLFIGLSIDFAIHLCIRYDELRREGIANDLALQRASGDVGGSLVLCAVTTTIGFYAFVPTDYHGVAELGLIAGTGMLVSLLTNLSLLPALITLTHRPAQPPAPRRSSPSAAALANLPFHQARPIVIVAGLLALVALWFAPQARFDYNPLRLRDPNASSVRTMDEMLADGQAFPWNVHLLAPDLASAENLEQQLEALPEVAEALTLSDFVPTDQARKVELMQDAAFLLGPALEVHQHQRKPHFAEQLAALSALESELQRQTDKGDASALGKASRSLAKTVARFRIHLAAVPEPEQELEQLESNVLGHLTDRLAWLRDALAADRFDLEDLPQSLVERHVAPDGRVRVEIFPNEDLNDNAALERYVDAILSVDASAFGEGRLLLEAGEAVVGALRQALSVAAVAIVLMLIVLWRNVADAALVAVPLGLAALFTTAGCVLIGMPLTFANVIVIPLLLGMGVDSGIHLVHRYRLGLGPGGNVLRTSTARAVLYSALTTIASFGTLGFSTHPGMASLGKLLSMGIALVMICNLAVLPALITLSLKNSNR